MGRTIGFVLLVMALVGSSGVVHGQNGFSFIDRPDTEWLAQATVEPRMECAALSGVRLDGVTLIRARYHAGDENAPAHCRVSGFIAPEIQFEVTLPDQWNRRLYMFGNGGYAGEDLTAPGRIQTRNRALSRGFLTVQQNTGHDARMFPLASFAENNLQRLIDYASRAVHVTVQTAKSLAEHYYDRPPAYSYWDGCSTGGRQGLMAAQRYPGDFDGILAGAPVLDFTHTQLWGVWNAQALAEAPLTREQLVILAEAVMEKCDAVDGVEDGLITDPRDCQFDPRRDLPVCPDGANGGDCFTTAQIEALERIARGVVINGETVFPGIPWGVEGLTPDGVSGWDLWIVSEDGPSRQLLYGETFLKYMAFLPASGIAIDWRTFDFDARYDDIQLIRDILDATNPDLSEFASRGGRMITYFGWADPALNPLMAVNYYESVQQQMGSEETASFYRLYMVPGMAHCRGGYGPDVFDAFTPLVRWVEQGEPPTAITARQYVGGELVRSRPICPHPQRAVYVGRGSIDDAENFRCEAPAG